jgi:alkaline phosphatase
MVRSLPRYLSITFILLLAGSIPASSQTPRRVILFVADGAGTAHWTVARLVRAHLAVDQFPVVGLVDTRDANAIVTESSAAATSYAIGMRTFQGALGLGPDSQPRTTALERARANGMAVGLMTTTAITDATPAAFAAHYPSRDHLEVAREMASERIDVLMGGGRHSFAAAMFHDSTTALDRLRARDTYVETAAQLRALDLDTVTTLAALLADGDLPLAPERDPSLAQMTQTALAVLNRDPQGFFLLVENEETDNQAHANRPFPTIASEMEAFDDAVRAGLEYQNAHPETLLIVLGDHETGGMSILSDSNGEPVLHYSTRGHSAAMVPLFARGPGAERFGGFIANEDVGKLLAEAVGG